MNGKILSLTIVLLMIIGSFGVAGTNQEVENDCGCVSYGSNDVDTVIQDEHGVHYTGLLHDDSHTIYPSKDDMFVLNNLPSSFDWRNADLDSDGNGVDGNKNFVTSIKDQGDCASCWAFAACGAFESKIKIEKYKEDRSYTGYPDLSEQYLLSCFADKNCNKQVTTYQVFNYIEEHGIMKDSCFRYTSGGGDPVPDCKDSCSKWYHFRSFQKTTYIGGTSSIKSLLITHGPLYTEMDKDNDGVIDHSVVIVGYTSSKWILKNSWGTDHDDNGYFKVNFDTHKIGNNLVEIDYVSGPELGYDGPSSLHYGETGAGNRLSDKSITITNIGEYGSSLWWNIERPDFGSWTFRDPSGASRTTGNLDADESIVLTIEFTAPDEQDHFSGSLIVKDGLNPDDCVVIPVSITTPKSISASYQMFTRFLEKFPFFNQFFFSFFNGKLR